MLKWAVVPHQWFEELVEWLLEIAIVSCKPPRCLREGTFVDMLGPLNVSEEDLRDRCRQLLRLSRYPGEWYRIPPDQLLVVYHLLQWGFEHLPHAANNIVQVYFPRGFLEAPPSSTLGPVPSLTFRAGPPPRNHTHPGDEMERCLRGGRDAMRPSMDPS